MTAAIKLDAEESRRAIDAAISTQAPVILEAQAFPGLTLNGFLISGDQAALLIEMTGRPAIDLDGTIGARCEGQIHGERRYRFFSVITGAPAWGRSRCIAIERPAAISLVERRRFLRTWLAQSSKVTLEWRDGGGSRRHLADLLNVSADGLACRVPDDVGAGLEKRCRLRVDFQLPDQAASFSFDAWVTNKMPASDGCMILGVQFVTTGEDAALILALRSAINRKSAPTESEVYV